MATNTLASVAAAIITGPLVAFYKTGIGKQFISTEHKLLADSAHSHRTVPTVLYQRVTSTGARHACASSQSLCYIPSTPSNGTANSTKHSNTLTD